MKRTTSVLGLVGLILTAGLVQQTTGDADAQTVAAAKAHCKVIAHRALYQGTENQVAGVENAARWGFAEVDASVDKNGALVAVHDGKLGRLTGGDLRGYVGEYTRAEMNAETVSHPYGEFRLTTRLIAAAARENTPIMVTVNKWGRIRQAGYAQSTLDTLYAAAQAHPRPELVFIGGFGAQDAMRSAHPDQAVFWRYDHDQTVEEIVANIKAEDVDLVALPKKRHTVETVDQVRALGTVTRITTRQIENRDEARRAQRAGIKILQGNWPRRLATRWCR